MIKLLLILLLCVPARAERMLREGTESTQNSIFVSSLTAQVTMGGSLVVNSSGTFVSSVTASAFFGDGSHLGGVSGATPYIQIQEQQPFGTFGGDAVVATWTQLNLNTVVSDTGGNCTLGTNTFVLAAGTYRLTGYTGFHATAATTWRLYNDTASTMLVLGGSNDFSSANYSAAMVPIQGRFTVAASQTLEFQYFAGHNTDVSDLGYSVGESGSYSVFTDIVLEKE